MGLSEDFRETFKNYIDGKLPEKKKKEFEAELERLEEYQAIIDENIGDAEEETTIENKTSIINQAKLLRRSKWKARFQNALTAIGIIFIITFIGWFSMFTCKLLTQRYYNSGNHKVQIYQDVVSSLVAVTQPNVRVRSNMGNSGTFFTLNIKTELSKTVGREDIKAGYMNMKFSFDKVKYPDRKWDLNQGPNHTFLYPNPSKWKGYATDWKKLEILGEGTVVEAFISLDKFYETEEILQKFKDKELSLLWFAVDTGADAIVEDRPNFMTYSLGFPTNVPVIHGEDIEFYSSGKLRNENFITTLGLLKKYESIADTLVLNSKLDLQRRLDYVNKNGVKIYGVVVTGPSKEILKLKDEQWITNMRTGEVMLWNWN